MKTFEIETEDGKQKLYFAIGKYPNKRILIKLIDANDEMSLVTVSHNFPDADVPEDGYFHAKYWSENNDIFMRLLRSGVIIPHKKEKESFYFSDKLMNRICPMEFRINPEYL